LRTSKFLTVAGKTLHIKPWPLLRIGSIHNKPCVTIQSTVLQT